MGQGQATKCSGRYACSASSSGEASRAKSSAASGEVRSFQWGEFPVALTKRRGKPLQVFINLLYRFLNGISNRKSKEEGNGIMERVCGYCKKSIGEKCGGCGSTNVRTLVVIGNYREFECADCGRQWKFSDDPKTTGICDTCFPKVMKNYGIPFFTEA